jgi:hypothetical protein
MFPENVVQATMQRVQTKYHHYNLPQGRRGQQKKTAMPPPAAAGDPQQENGTMADGGGYLVTAGQQPQQIPFRKKIENVNGMNILGEWKFF